MTKVFQIFIRYTIRNIIGMIGLSCYILADTYFIAKGLGANGLTALNLAIPVYSFIYGLGMMIGMGGATRYSIEKEIASKQQTDLVFSHAVWMAVWLSVVLVGMGVTISRPLAFLLGADAVTVADTSSYLRITMIFAPMFLINQVLLCFVRNDKNPGLSMMAMLIGSFANIVLDYILIFPLQLGMFGAALATGCSPIVSMLILSVHFWKKQNGFSLKKIKWQKKRITDIVILGLTSFVGEISSGIVIIVFNLIILDLTGNVGVAAYGIVANISLVAIAIYNGLAQGVQPIISEAYGMGNSSTVKLTYRYAVITEILLAIAIYGLVFGFSEPIVALFNEEKNAVLAEIASLGLKQYFTAFLFAGFNIVTTVFLNSIDQPRKAFTISIVRGFIVITLLAFIMSKLFGMSGVWFSFPVCEGITTILSVFLIYFQKKKRTEIRKTT
ncbi:Multidrug export protein MepA [Clostridiales bacterium CHKCI001]|nr:Multidrug export protein MepA [Clostridiales bacterium CHKCI001]